MKYRSLDADGDYNFGSQLASFLVDSPETVAQAILTRLQLFRGEWFPDTSVGAPTLEAAFGEGASGAYDREVQTIILETPGVLEFVSYYSFMDTTRHLHIECTISIIYSIATVSTGVQ